jgi:hypothetical protein
MTGTSEKFCLDVLKKQRGIDTGFIAIWEDRMLAQQDSSLVETIPGLLGLLLYRNVRRHAARSR